MTLNQLFVISNFYATSLWVLIIVFPKWKITQKILSSLWLFIPFILLYIYYLSASVNIESIEILSSFQLEDIALLFGQEGFAAATWVHLLLIDLFLGRWIYWEGQKSQIWTIHSLLLCVFFAPVGLLSHLITDAIFNKNDDADSNSPDEQKSDSDTSLAASK